MYAFGYQEGAISKLFATRPIDDAASIGLACYQRHGALLAALRSTNNHVCGVRARTGVDQRRRDRTHR